MYGKLSENLNKISLDNIRTSVCSNVFWLSKLTVVVLEKWALSVNKTVVKCLDQYIFPKTIEKVTHGA